MTITSTSITTNYVIVICFTSELCCAEGQQTNGHGIPISVKSFSPLGQKFTTAITAGLQVNLCQFLSLIALAVCSEIDSHFLAALRTFPIRTFEDKSLRIEPG